MKLMALTNFCGAAILAGGASRRMGTPKALLALEGELLVARVAAVLRPLFADVIVVTASAPIAAAAGVPAVPDRVEGRGPLGGIQAALAHFGEPLGDSVGKPVFCVACDMPHLRADFIEYLVEQLGDHDAVVPRRGAYDEPLHALYAPSCLAAIERELARPRVGPVDNIFHDLRVRFVDEHEARRFDPELRMFDNWNTPEDVKKSRGQ